MDVESHQSVLVVASNDTLRRSLTFVLEAEGYAVASHSHVPAQAEPRSQCIVVDEDSLDRAKDVWDRLARLADAIVVLLSRTRELPAHIRVHAVEKPLLGKDLVEAVRVALHRKPAST
jgi:FixJ family two-component response regulator